MTKNIEGQNFKWKKSHNPPYTLEFMSLVVCTICHILAYNYRMTFLAISFTLMEFIIIINVNSLIQRILSVQKILQNTNSKLKKNGVGYWTHQCWVMPKNNRFYPGISVRHEQLFFWSYYSDLVELSILLNRNTCSVNKYFV